MSNPSNNLRDSNFRKNAGTWVVSLLRAIDLFVEEPSSSISPILTIWVRVSMCAMLGSQGGENQDVGCAGGASSVFDRNPDPALDELTSWPRCCAMPTMPTWAGWTYNRLWFKARYGFKATDQPRAVTACQWMLEKGEPLLIADAGQDPRFPPRAFRCPTPSPAFPMRRSADLRRQQIIGTLAVLARRPDRFKPEHLTLLEFWGGRW
jgi:GAF domain-containing protein